MKRLLWLGIGIAVGALAARAVTRAGQVRAPSGEAGSGPAGSMTKAAAGVLEAVRDFVADVREGMAQREEQIHEAFARGVALDDLEDLGEFGDLEDLDDLAQQVEASERDQSGEPEDRYRHDGARFRR